MSSPVESPFGVPNEQLASAQAQNAMILGQNLVKASDATIADISTRVLQWITTALEGLVSGTAALGAKVATPIVTSLNAMQAGTDQLGASITGSIKGQLAAAGAAPAGGTAESGVVPGQYPYQMWSRKTQTGWLPPILIPTVGPQPAGPDYCFRGGWADVIDAVNWQRTAPGIPPNACPSPGGPAPVPVGPPPTGSTCDSGYRVWQLTGPPGTASQCQIVCSTDPNPPAGWVPYGVATDLATAQQQMQAICAGGTGTGGPTICPPPVVCPPATVCPPPCDPSLPAGTPCVTTTQTVITPPDNNACCGPNGQQIAWPSCIYIDLCSIDNVARAITKGLCDWSQDDDCFYTPIWRAIKKGLCEFVKDPECQCKFRDSDVALYEDCDNQLGEMVQGWAGRLGGILTSTPVDQMAEAAGEMAGAVGASTPDTGPDPWGPG